MRILIIEENPDAANRVTQSLSGSDFEIELAEDSENALLIHRSGNFDLIFGDLKLLKSHLPQFEIPVIILSNPEDENEAIALLSRGAADYLIRPEINETLMKRALRYASEHKRQEEQIIQKDSALKACEEKLIYAAKLETSGNIAASVAHEVKNPLAVIQLGLDSLVSFHDKPALTRHPSEEIILGRIQNAIERANLVISELLDFSSDTSLQWELADINETIDRVISLITPQLNKSRIEYQSSYDKNTPLIRIDRRKIEQALINVIINAEQALESTEDRKIRLETKIDPEDDLLKIVIEDSGPGIEEEKISRIFEPFYTTKGPKKGTGLGMTVVRSIIELHHGTLRLGRSELGGLLVEFQLPLESK